MANHKLRRILFTQGGKCFYCRKPLPEEDATLDHIVPKSQGGTESIDNLGACCKDINQLFANAPVKSKIETIILWEGRLPCQRHE